jgi:hypothetical protein
MKEEIKRFLEPTSTYGIPANKLGCFCSMNMLGIPSLIFPVPAILIYFFIKYLTEL